MHKQLTIQSINKCAESKAHECKVVNQKQMCASSRFLCEEATSLLPGSFASPACEHREAQAKTEKRKLMNARLIVQPNKCVCLVVFSV